MKYLFLILAKVFQIELRENSDPGPHDNQRSGLLEEGPKNLEGKTRPLNRRPRTQYTGPHIENLMRLYRGKSS